MESPGLDLADATVEKDESRTNSDEGLDPSLKSADVDGLMGR